jgi:2-oxoglutarate ferredoxin oxidoreductase subunit gamma
VLAPGGLIVLNSSLADPPGNPGEMDILEIPATELADDIGSVRVANMIMLSALNEARGLVTPRRLVETLASMFSGQSQALIPLNEQALETGRRLARTWTEERGHSGGKGCRLPHKRR